MNGIQTPAAQFNWNGTDWAGTRRRVRDAVNSRPAPTPPPAPKASDKATGGKGEDYVWGKSKPSAVNEGDTVLPGVIKKAVADGLMGQGDDKGFVVVGG